MIHPSSYTNKKDYPSMAISVPIGTEHYMWLKEISEKLDLSLKKTMEHLVSFYYSEIMEGSSEKMKEEKEHSTKGIHDIEMTAPSLIYQQRPATIQVQQQRPDTVQVQQRNVFATPQIRNEPPKPTKDIIPPKIVSSNSPLLEKYANTLVENNQTISKPEIITIPLYNPNSHGCPSCGASKNSDAKFCHNCGHSL
jgi:hypothetical protein